MDQVNLLSRPSHVLMDQQAVTSAATPSINGQFLVTFMMPVIYDICEPVKMAEM